MLHSVVSPSLPASGVTHSLVGKFSDKCRNGVREMILFKKNNLELWQILLSDGTKEKDAPVSYVVGVQLNAPPVSVAICRPQGFTVDIVAMCFDDFHLSFIQYDPLLMRFHTLALVQLDDRDVAQDVTPLEPIMRADPMGCFVTVLARRSYLFLIPLLGLKKGDDADVNDTAASNECGGNDTKEKSKNGSKEPREEILAPTDDWGDEDDYKETTTDENKINTNNNTNSSNNNYYCGSNQGEEGEKFTCLEDPMMRERSHRSQEAASAVVDMSGKVLHIGDVTMLTLSAVAKGCIRYVRDMQFIESSGEPIIAFLCERQPTWAGRVKLVEWRTKMVESNMLSMQVVWVQISAASRTDRKLLPIGEVDDVPYNVTHMMPVGPFAQTPSGVICFGSNTVMHVTTKRGYGVYFNEGGMEECVNSKSPSMSFGKAVWCDKQMEKSTDLFKVNLSLANCASVFLSAVNDVLKVLAVSEEDGVVLALKFITQGSTVQCIKIDILGIGCYSSCMSLIGDNVVFLGSARSDSCIAHIDTCHNDKTQRFQVIEQMEAIGFINDVDVVDCTSGAGDKKGQEEITEQSTCSDDDKMPYAQLIRSAILDPMPKVPIMESRAVMDLAVCAGYAGSGSIFVLRKSIRNNVVRREKVNAVSAFFLESSRNVKSFSAGHEENEGEATHVTSRPPPPPHLLLTGLSFTILFVVRNELVQHVRRSEFVTSCRTVFAAGVPWLDALLQITEREGRIISADGRLLLHKFCLLPEREMEAHRHVKAARVASDFQLLFVLLEDGTLLRFELKTLQVAATKKTVADHVAAFALWKKQQRVVLFDMEGSMIISDIEADYYSGMKIFRFAALPKYSVFGLSEHTGTDDGGGGSLSFVTHVEVSMFCDNTGDDVTSLLVILTTGELAVYRVIDHDIFGPLRFIKYFSHFLDNKAEREVIESIEMKKQRMRRERGIIENDTQLMRHCSQRIIPFDDIGGNTGVYVCGQHPLFFFWDRTMRQLVAYRHQSLGPVRGFVPFKFLKNGFIYCCEGFVDFASMNTYLKPNGYGWLTRRIHLGATPHFIVYHPPAHGCFVVSSLKEPFRPQRAFFDVELKITYNEENGGIQSVTAEPPLCNMAPIAPTSGIRVSMADRFEVRFMTTAEWKLNDTLLLEENEQVLGAQMMEIHCDNGVDGSGTAPVCIVSTAFPLGEDVTCRGRILVIATTSVNKVQKVRVVHSEPLNGPATSVVGIRNHIAVAVGGSIKIFRYDWESRKMVVSALLYAGMYVTKMSAFRNYLIYGDLFSSCTIARFNEQNHTLSVMGRDHNMVNVVHCDMMYHDRAFGVLCSDDKRNVLVMGYTPRVQEMGEGEPGNLLESVLSLDGEYRLPSGCLLKSLRFRSLAGNSSVTLYVTNYGEIGFIVPIGEQANRTALWVTRRLQIELPHDAGLTPRMFLGLSQRSPRTALKAKELLISGPLLTQFFSLDVCTRKAISTAAYTQLERVTNVAALVYEECCLF